MRLPKKIWVSRDIYGKPMVITSTGERYHKYFGKRSAFRVRLEDPTVEKQVIKEGTELTDHYPNWFKKLWNNYNDHDQWSKQLKQLRNEQSSNV
jgi:hypothetical protein